MPCYHPLHAFQIGFTDEGKKKLKICSGKTETLIDYTRQGFKELQRPPTPWEESHFQCNQDFIPIPCGQCIGCRLEYSKQWATRCMLEAKKYEHNYFVTLTYDNEHLPITDYTDPVSGVIGQSMTLVPRDHTLFMKRLRKEYGDNIRYYMCGEYGDESLRPHFHYILFNLPLDDLKVYKINSDGQPLYNSERLQKLWPNGYVVVANVTFQTCAYVARYVTKKLTGKKADHYTRFNLERPFVRMSRRPGIARDWFNENFDTIYQRDEIVLENGLSVRPPRYFDKLFEVDYPDELETIKEYRRNAAELIQQSVEDRIDLNYLDYLEVCENVKKNKTKVLTRDNF